MSYKALLFCPDEAAARLVTQVLSELEFTVELSFEPFVTVKKLSEEHYDALVVDCVDEQNASVLFKGARNSELNHSSLCVAVVDGQAGLAKAFKIGANLVLTKPINVEQSKNTLRVARGLLRKNAPSATGTTTPHSQPAAAPIHHDALPERSQAASATLSSTQSEAHRPAMPSTLLEAQQEKAPAATPHVAASHESKVETSEKSAAQSHFLGFSGSPGAVPGHAGSAAAPALAPDRSSTTPFAEAKPATEIKSAAPLATHNPIQSTYTPSPAPLPMEVAPHPLPSLHAKPSSSKAPWVVIVLLVAGAGGYFAWQKFQPLHYLKSRSQVSATQPLATEQGSSAGDLKPSPEINSPGAEQLNGSPAGTVVTSSPASETPSAISSNLNSAPEGFPTKESIDVGVPPEKAEPAITVVAKPEPIQVNQKPAASALNHAQPAAVPAPPSLALPGANSSDSTIAGIVATNAVVPKPSGALQISQGITQGLLTKKVPPTYPSMALQMRKQGTVELMATISKTGSISKLRVTSGDPTLAKAAVDAVKQWKYRPYLLNNEPVEIETQITINFHLPN